MNRFVLRRYVVSCNPDTPGIQVVLLLFIFTFKRGTNFSLVLADTLLCMCVAMALYVTLIS